MTTHERLVEDLYRRRPRSRFVRLSAAALVVLAIGAWFVGDFPVADLLSNASGEHLSDFAERVVPQPVRGRAFDGGVVLAWAGDLMRTKGWTAAGRTFAISLAAILLAALAGLVLCLPAARTFATPEPFLPGASAPGRLTRLAWTVVRVGVRTFLVFLRSIPEDVWAFLLFGILGANAWPAVLALALHNAGILGKLGAEVVENLPPAPLRALRGLGARRTQVAAAGVFPAALPRFLLYFFYRWETCVREATVLGMLGILSLGTWITDARHRLHYDELVFWILVGAAIVLVGDLLSTILRGAVRRAS